MSAHLAFTFPGQGSQRVGMLDAIPHSSDLERLLDAAEALSGLPLRRIAAGEAGTDLADTRASQPLLYLADWAWAKHLERAGIAPAAVAGHSLGEFAALAFAGVFSVEAGLALVCARSAIMADVAARTPGGMAAVIGMDRASLLALMAGADGVWVANDNGAGQVVISGTHPGIEWATGALTAAGARRVLPLAVAGPFHSPLMAEARQEFNDVLADTRFADARIPVLQNTDPTPAVDAATIHERLATQITEPVRWTETLDNLRAGGVDTVIETGPGAVLTGIARRVEGFTALAAESEPLARLLEVSGS